MENKDKTGLAFLEGKTVERIEWVPYVTLDEDKTQVDDGDYVMIHFTDGFKASFVGGHQENYTGESSGEYPTYLTVTIHQPEGFNGPGMYEALIKSEQSTGDLQELYGFTFRGEYKDIPTQLYRFRADSLEHAKSLFNLKEVSYVKWLNNGIY